MKHCDIALLGERQLLAQSRKQKHPDPEVSALWKPPARRAPSQSAGDSDGGTFAADSDYIVPTVEIDSNVSVA